MAESVKIDESDLNEINELKNTFGMLTSQMGQVEIEIFLVNKHLEELKVERERILQQYLDTEKSEGELVDKLNKKYGEGYIDTTTNTFIPES